MSEEPTSESVSPVKVIEKLASAVPEECRKNIVVIGSLAAGYRYFAHDEDLLVQTKDIDCLIHPFVEAVEAGEAITETLMANGWSYAPTEDSSWKRHTTPASTVWWRRWRPASDRFVRPDNACLPTRSNPSNQ